MLGAIIGDIIGSSYEFYPHNVKTTDFALIKLPPHTRYFNHESGDPFTCFFFFSVILIYSKYET